MTLRPRPLPSPTPRRFPRRGSWGPRAALSALLLLGLSWSPGLGGDVLAQGSAPSPAAPTVGEPPPEAAGPPPVEATGGEEEEAAGRRGKRGDKRARKQAERAALESLPPVYREWLELVGLILSDGERETFLALDKDYQRDAFIEQFWRARDPYPGTARNEFKERWLAHAEEAKLQYGGLEDDRSRILLLNGLPAGTYVPDCVALWPLEIWYYDRNAERVRDQFFLIFFQRAAAGAYRLWQPAEGVAALTRFLSFSASLSAVANEIISTCLRGDEIVGILNSVLQRGQMDYSMLLARLQTPPEEALSGEWVATFNSYTTDLDEGAATFEARLVVAYPGRHQNRTLLQGSVLVPVGEVEAATLGPQSSYNFVLTGEVLREDKLFESFRYRFDLPAADLGGETMPLVFERTLRPGDYTLIVKVEDLASKRVFRRVEPLAVPLVEAVPPEPADPETARLLAEANAAISSGDATIEIVQPIGDLLTGMVRFDTLTTGRDIASVAFALDGREVLRKTRPPYSVELDLGSLPRTRTLVATAYGAGGVELDDDLLQLNAGSHRFATRLVEPRRGESYERSLRALAEVEVPEGEALERVEFYRDETLVATLYQPPWEQPIVLPETGQVSYVRAVAYQPDGRSTEDLVFVNAPEYLEEVDVQFVELYAAVTDKALRPVEGLGQGDFAVLEDGVPQDLVRFDRVSDLPIHAGVLVDVSASMEPSLETAKLAALAFFEGTIQSRDRATLITFNDLPQLAVKFTNDLGTLAGGLAGLKAERGTSLYDSVIFALFYFNGIKGQRALILLSDGKDESSRFLFDDALEYARRAGVALYAIGLDLPKADRGLVKRELTRLADETGGRSFFIDDISALGGIYAEIERELRSRYYLAYQSSNTSGEDVFREIEVRVLRPGTEAKTLKGYYP